MVQTQTFTSYRKCNWAYIIEHRKLDMIIIDETSKKAQIVDFAVPADHRIEISQQRNIENYQDLKRELQKL